MKTERQEKLEILSAKLRSSREQILKAQESTISLEKEISLLEKEVDLEVINSPEFFEEMKKLEYQLYLDWDHPKMVHEFIQSEKYPVVFNTVKNSLALMKDHQVYKQDNVYFYCPYLCEVHICSNSMKDLLKFAKSHKLKWYNKSISFLNEEIVEAKNSLNHLNKIKRLMEKYK